MKNFSQIFQPEEKIVVAQKCLRCGYENADTMRFCLNCGAALAAAPNEAPTESFSGGTMPSSFTAPRETETFSRPQQFSPVPLKSSPAQPKSKLGLIVGGLAALFFLIFIAAAAIIFFNWRARHVTIAETTPTPFLSPSPHFSASPKFSPSPDFSPSPELTPQSSFTPPITATKTGSFTVYANDGWQLSQIDVVPLEQFQTSVQGLADLAGIKTGVSSNGLTDAKTLSRRIYPEFPTGALLMRTRYADGKYSNLQPVTAPPSKGNWQNFPDERGKLEFCINDNAPRQNGGQFIVSAKMLNVPKTK